MTEQQAMRMALEALEYANTGNRRPEVLGPAITAIRQALEQQPADEPVAIKWEKDADKECPYNNWVGITPFGRILITWKGWKDYDDACVDEFPGDFRSYGSPDEVKAACEAEYLRRLYTRPQPAAWVGLTEEEIEMIVENRRAAHWEFVRQVEAALRSKNG